MVPEDGDPAPKPGSSVGPPVRSSGAFAATIAPTTGSAGAHPSGIDATIAAPPPSIAKVAVDETVAAPVTGTLPPLPEVSAALYRTDREIARGGMGRIVAAEDRRLGRPVALKELLEPAGDQITRFQREALITARLQHPGIVPVYEAGCWPTGEPFFAMKLVSGRPLDRVIAEATRLEDRLALLQRLAAACDAIAYAHSQRIIHRDLKPGNVLIGDFGETVVIDWGLAKDLDAADTPESQNRAPRSESATRTVKIRHQETQDSTLTVAGAVMGTPAYMPPEQARGEPVDQRADVFALGAMLYHLLAGLPPYNARTATEVLAAAAVGKVIPLHEREKRVPAELVAIVERAMAPLREDRYPDAGGLAEDLRRFLTGQLVDAHRYTAVQRVARFVKRHRAAVTIAAIAVVGFAVGGTVAVTRIVRAKDQAQHEQRIATTRKTAAERLVDYMFSDLKSRLTQAGRLDLLAGLGAEVKRYYATLSRIPGGMPREDELRMAEAIELIGQAEHTSGKADEALATWREAHDKLAAIVAAEPTRPTRRLRQMIARLDYESGLVYQERGTYDKALELFHTAQQEFDQLRAEDPSAREVLLGAAQTHDTLGDLLRNEGKIDQAFEQYSEAKNERELAASKGNGKVTDEVMALSTSHLKLASVYQNRGESATALEEYKIALRLRETLLETQPDNVQIQEAVLDVEDQQAELQRQIGDEHAAIDTYRRALPVTQALIQRDPTNTQWIRQRGNMLADLGFALIDSGAFTDGFAQLDLAIETQKDLLARDPKSTRYQTDLSRSYTRIGDALLYQGKPDDAIASYRTALDMRRALVAKDPNSVPYRRAVAWAYAKLAGAYAFKGDTAHALDAHEQALALREQLVAESPAQGGFKNELASTEAELGKLVAARDARRADALVAAALERAHALVDGDPISNEWKETLVQALLARATVDRGDPVKRTDTLERAEALALEASRRAPQNAHWPGLLAEIRAGQAEVAAAKGDPKTASARWKDVRELLEPLARDHRLPAPRVPLLDRARAQR